MCLNLSLYFPLVLIEYPYFTVQLRCVHRFTSLFGWIYGCLMYIYSFVDNCLCLIRLHSQARYMYIMLVRWSCSRSNIPLFDVLLLRNLYETFMIFLSRRNSIFSLCLFHSKRIASCLCFVHFHQVKRGIVNNRIGFVCSSHHQANFYWCFRIWQSNSPFSVRIYSVHNILSLFYDYW